MSAGGSRWADSRFRLTKGQLHRPTWMGQTVCLPVSHRHLSKGHERDFHRLDRA